MERDRQTDRQTERIFKHNYVMSEILKKSTKTAKDGGKKDRGE